MRTELEFLQETPERILQNQSLERETHSPASSVSKIKHCDWDYKNKLEQVNKEVLAKWNNGFLYNNQKY